MSKLIKHKKIYPVKFFTIFNSSYLTWNFYFTGIIFTLIIFFSFFGAVGKSEAAITFTDGKWETTFDCAEQTVITAGAFSCDELRVYLDSVASDGSNSLISSGDNYPDGLGGNGYSQVDGYGDSGEGYGRNDSSQSIYVGFPSAQKEFWIRYYIKFPTNWQASPFGWDKYFYCQTVGSQVQTLLEPDSGGFRVIVQGGTDGSGIYRTTEDYKVSDMLGGSYVGDGKWHCIEMHLKMDTDGTDGQAHVWVDGDLKVDFDTGVNHSNGIIGARDGFIHIALSINQSKIINVNNTFARVAIDDIVIYNTTPPNTDSEGNPYIGPIESSDTTPPSHPQGLSVE